MTHIDPPSEDSPLYRGATKAQLLFHYGNRSSKIDFKKFWGKFKIFTVSFSVLFICGVFYSTTYQFDDEALVTSYTFAASALI